MKCIEKRGNFDNYILKTPEREMRSEYGMMLKDHMLKRLSDPAYIVPYLPKQHKIFRNKHKERAKRLSEQVIWHPPSERRKDLTELEFNPLDRTPSHTEEELEYAKQYFRDTIPHDEMIPKKIRDLPLSYDYHIEEKEDLAAAEELAKKLGIKVPEVKDRLS